ncbi:MAG TPA: outer membrane protein assembly factor BamD, partial [Gemmatirosa sp.]
AVLGLAAACAPGFEAAKYTNPVDLYRAAGQRMQRHKWGDALAGYDRLASQLPARDTLLPRVYFAQGQAHGKQGEHLLAAQAYARIQDAFPDDSLAPEALFQEGREYQKLWDKPSLDPQYGQTALATFRQLLQLYPDSPRVPDATKAVADVNQMFAAKDLETGMHYLRRKAYDPALIYFKDVVRLYPGTPAARMAYLRMVQSYKAINYKEEIAEACTDMRRTYPADVEVRQTCAIAPATTAATGGATGGATGTAAPSTPAAGATASGTSAPTTPAGPPAAPTRPPAPVPQASESPASAGGGGRP